MPTISKLNVMLTGNASGYIAELNAADRHTQGFVSSVTHAGARVGELAAGFATADAIKGAVVGIAHYVTSTVDGIEATARFAQSVGVSVEAMSRLQYAAKIVGAPIDALNTGIEHMVRSMAEARMGTGTAAAAFESLGLKVNDLAKLPADQQMAVIADALNSVKNKGDAAGAAFEIFGRGAAEIIPLLQQGSGNMAKLGAESDKTGNTLRAVDAQKVLMAGEAMRKLEAVSQGVANSLAIGLAPYITAISEKLFDMKISGTSTAQKISHGFQYVAVGLAKGADELELMKAGFYYMESGALDAFSGIFSEVDQLGAAMVKLLNLIPKVHVEWTESFKDAAKGDQFLSQQAFTKAIDAAMKYNRGAASTSVQSFFDDLDKRAADAAKNMQGSLNGIDLNPMAQKLREYLDDLQKKVDQFSMNEAQKAVAEVKVLGGTLADQQRASALANQLDALEKSKKAMDDLAKSAQQAWEETRTPMEKYQEQLQKLNELLLLHKLGLGGIDQDTFDRAALKAQGMLDQSPSKLADTFEAGSQSAARYVAEFTMGRGKDDLQTQLLQTARDGNTKAGKLIEEVQKVAKDIASNFAFVTGF